MILSRFFGHFAMFAAVAALGACAGVHAPPAPKTPAQTVYELEGGLTAAVGLAGQYKALPACGPAGAGLCSDTFLVARIDAAAPAAQSAILAAEAIVADKASSPVAVDMAIEAATSALATLQGLIPPAK